MRPILEFHAKVILTIAALLTLTCAAGAYELELPSEDYRWIKVETPNFTVFSNADEKITRSAAVSLEHLWAVLARDFDGVPSVSLAPTYVYVFDRFTDAYKPYGPLSKKGRPKQSGGFVLGRQPANYIAIVERDYQYPNRMEIYRDFVNVVLEANHPEVPLWLEEGLAEYYSVFHIKEGRARVGYRINRHIARIRNEPLIPLATLLAINRDSPEYDEKDRTGIFYAESWLLTHMLVTEHPNGRAQMEAYAGLLREGVDRDTAFTTAFETTYEELEEQLRKYIRARSYHYKEFPLSTKIVENTEISEMSRAELLFRLGDLLTNGLSDRYDFAAEHFKAAIVLDEDYEPAIAGLGQIEEAAGRNEAALGRWDRAATLSADDHRINLTRLAVRTTIEYGQSTLPWTCSDRNTGDGGF